MIDQPGLRLLPAPPPPDPVDPSPAELAAAADEISAAFVEFGYLTREVDELSVPVAAWRAAARRVAKRLNNRAAVTYFLVDGRIEACLQPWPDTPEEEHRYWQQIRTTFTETGAFPQRRPIPAHSPARRRKRPKLTVVTDPN